MSQEVDYSALKARLEKICSVRERIAPLKADALERAGRQLLGEVRGRIGGAGKVQSWQEVYKGSRGGYAAVRPAAKTWDARGYVTNAIESGHRVRGPSGRARRYRYRGRGLSRVPGRGFYRDTRASAESLSAQIADELAAAVAKEMIS